MPEMPRNAEKVDGVNAPMPWLRRGKPYESFVALREEIMRLTGHDFLAVCGDMMRSPNFHSNKPGVAERSWHKTGRAFDYNQGDSKKVFVMEPAGGQVMFRTFIRCQPGFEQNGESIAHLKQWVHGSGANASIPAGSYVDFTALALENDYHRIPAWKKWVQSGMKTYSTMMEFWHYQCDEGLSWSDAMADLLDAGSQSDGPRVLGRNDRGDDVKQLQRNLVALGYLENDDVDGIFGADTAHALMALQAANGLTADGIAGPVTMAKIKELIRALD
jgi:murein L,D-transpeptidase YcbB/YkuD